MTRRWTSCLVPGTSRSLTRCPPGGPGCRPRSPRWLRRDLVLPVALRGHMPCGVLCLAGAYGLRGLRLAGYAAEEGRRARLQFRCRAAAVPAAYRDHAWRHQFEAVEETQNVIPGVDVY